MSRIVFVNGKFVKEQEAVISIFDRGFIFGDGIYEVVPVIRGKIIDRDYFLERLERSLFELSIPWPCSDTISSRLTPWITHTIEVIASEDN